MSRVLSALSIWAACVSEEEEEGLNESGQFTPHFTEPQPTGRACSSNELYQTLLSWSSTQPLHLHLGRKAKAIRIKLNQDKN